MESELTALPHPLLSSNTLKSLPIILTLSPLYVGGFCLCLFLGFPFYLLSFIVYDVHRCGFLCVYISHLGLLGIICVLFSLNLGRFCLFFLEIIALLSLFSPSDALTCALRPCGIAIWVSFIHFFFSEL